MSDDQLIASRYLDADPALVWEAFTVPEHVAAFWGGHHADIPVESVTIDLRRGGSFALDTVGPGGARHPLRFTYLEIDEPKGLVFEESATGIVTHLVLEPQGDGTVLTIHQRRLPPELRTRRAATGLAGILDQLEDLLRRLRRPSPAE